jgi:hypothetical protein
MRDLLRPTLPHSTRRVMLPAPGRPAPAACIAAPAPTARRAASAPPVTPVRPRLAAIAPAQADGGDQPRQLVRPAGSGPRFRYIAGPAAGQPGDVAGEDGTDLLIRAGTHFVRNFSLTQGDKLDLTSILAGAPMAHDLANLGQFVKVLGYGQNDPGFGAGTKTTLEVTGPQGSAVVNFEGVGKTDLQHLLKHQSLMLPPHRAGPLPFPPFPGLDPVIAGEGQDGGWVLG